MNKHSMRLAFVLVLVLFVFTLANAQSTRIVYFSMFSEGEPLQQVLQKVTDDFMAANPDIQV